MKKRNLTVGILAMLSAMPAFCRSSVETVQDSACILTSRRVEVTMSSPGTLRQQMTEDDRDSCTTLAIHGVISSADIRTIRQLSTSGSLKVLDLRDARIRRDRKLPYLTVDAVKEKMRVRIIADRMMSNPYQKDYVNADRVVDYWTQKNVWGGSDSFSLEAYLDEDSSEPERVLTDYQNKKWIDFSKGFTDDWKLLRQTRTQKGPGYVLDIKDGKCRYEAYAQDDIISPDMFYGCSSLRWVVLSDGMIYNDPVTVENTKVKFVRFATKSR